MKKRAIIGVCMVIISILFIVIAGFSIDLFGKITGKVASGGEHTIGPSLKEQGCMKECVSQGCESGNMSCMQKNSALCLTKCNIIKPQETEETLCMEKCVVNGCDKIDFACQTKNKEKCEKECNMIKEPEAKSEEEKCIRECVNKASPGKICKPGEGGEKGDDICQKCAKECEHLYAGPCLNEEKLEKKKKECQTCEHCYGEPIRGDSGEGYECVTDIECKDASSEFGDNPGTGEGIVKSVGNAVTGFFESIGDFFSGIFGNKAEKE